MIEAESVHASHQEDRNVTRSAVAKPDNIKKPPQKMIKKLLHFFSGDQEDGSTALPMRKIVTVMTGETASD